MAEKRRKYRAYTRQQSWDDDHLEAINRAWSEIHVPKDRIPAENPNFWIDNSEYATSFIFNDIWDDVAEIPEMAVIGYCFFGEDMSALLVWSQGIVMSMSTKKYREKTS